MTTALKPEPKDCCIPANQPQNDDYRMPWQDGRENRRAVLKAVSARRAEMQSWQDNPTMVRREPVPPPVPQSVALLTALAYLQGLRDGEAVEDIDELASTADIHLWEIRPLLYRAEEKGYLTRNEDGSVQLTHKGWKWYERHEQDSAM